MRNLEAPKAAFERNLERARSFLLAYRELHGKRGRVPIARADLLRGVIVFSVAAMDAYVRDTISTNLARVVSSHLKAKKPLPKELVEAVKSAMDTEALLRAAYEERTGAHIRSAIEGLLATKSFQGPRAIEDCFKIVGMNNLMCEVAQKYGGKQKTLEKKIRGIANRRHQIVHQADLHRDKKKRGKPRDITVTYVEESIKIIDKFVECIEDVLKNYLENLD